MSSSLLTVVTPPGLLPLLPRRAVLGVTLGLLLPFFSPAFGQVDSTEAAPTDTVERPSQPPPADTQDVEEVTDPRSSAPFIYGTPRTDSLPGRLPYVGVEHILAREPGSFLYDLGAVGWPHGWSPEGFAPHRPHLWIDGLSYNDPLTGRPRYEIVPPSFLKRPRTGVDPGGGPVGVHLSSRDYAQIRPITELRYRRDSNGLHAIEVGHSQKRRLSLFGTPGLVQITFGYGGRKAEGNYEGSDLRSERRLWGRLRYQTDEWMVELNDRSTRYRIGAHGGVQPPRPQFRSIYQLPLAETSVLNADARRRTFRNDLTARARGPLLPIFSAPATASATWTSNTFDFVPGTEPPRESPDTTWTVKMNGGHGRIQQPLSVGAHHLTFTGYGRLWGVARSNVPQIDGTRWSAHAHARDSVRAGASTLTLDAGWHATHSHQHPSASAQASLPAGPFHLSASFSLSAQRASWIADEGFREFVSPLPADASSSSSQVLDGHMGLSVDLGPVDVELEGFAHQIQKAVDLYVSSSDPASPPTTLIDTVAAHQLSAPVRRAGATVSVGWRQEAQRGLYASGQGTALQFLNPEASFLHNRLAYTLPSVFGRARIGARFVLFQDLLTDLYVEGRGWSAMNSRWFHSPTGRLVVPPREAPIPALPGSPVGPSGTINVHAEARLREATLFFTFENVQAGTQLQPGTFVVPVYPLPARQFRFGVFWPIFD